MSIRILHLFPDLMNLYGDYANLSILTRYMELEGCPFEQIASNDPVDPSGFDLVFIGCGTERSSLRALELLLPFRDAFSAFLSGGGLLLLTGTAYEIFCRTIRDDGQDGAVFEGLGLIPGDVSRTHRKRYLGDVIYSFGEKEKNIIGFVNKCSQTELEGPALFRTGSEPGNTLTSGAEGYLAGGIAATGLTGPVLIKNPDLCRWLLDRLYDKAGFDPTQRDDMTVQRQAFEAAYRELLQLKQKM
ncbi:MAG: hypothetical protein IKQ73_03915 [Oscillospiraceae bacterium]|jgi:CobQ-like glutamine amidotransferase family enzyme|nr:hypothetical protein [Oscillospiraceae bacterium]